MEKQISIYTNSQELSGVLHIPNGHETEKKPAFLICHGFIGSKVGQHRMFVKLARLLCKLGVIVLRFDFSGCGESSGEYREVTITNQIQEAIAAIDTLVEHPNVDREKITLLGHSMGGAIAASIAAADPRIHKLILLSPVANPFTDLVNIVGQGEYQKALCEGTINFEGFEVGRDFFLALPKVRPLDTIHQFPGEVLLVHGSEDQDTPLENSYQYQELFDKRAQGHCKLRVIQGADHTYNSPLWEKELQEILIAWQKE